MVLQAAKICIEKMCIFVKEGTAKMQLFVQMRENMHLISLKKNYQIVMNM